MLITFKSKAAAEIMMYQSHIAPILEMLDKKMDRGVITAAESTSAIQKIEALIAQDQQQRKNANGVPIHESDLDEFEKKIISDTVSLSTRLYPFLEMLRAAEKKQVDILWGV